MRTLTEYYRREACKRLGVEAVTADAFIRLAINRLAARDKGVRIRGGTYGATIDIDVGDGYYTEATLSEALANAVLGQIEEPLSAVLRVRADECELQSRAFDNETAKLLRAAADELEKQE